MRCLQSEAAPWFWSCRLIANWLFGVAVDLVNVARGQRDGETDSRLGIFARSLHGVLVQMFEALVPDVCPPPPPWQLPATA